VLGNLSRATTTNSTMDVEVPSVILVSDETEKAPQSFTVKLELVQYSVTIKALLDAMPDDETQTIPLVKVNTEHLESVIKFLEHHHQEVTENPPPEMTEAEERAKELTEWEKNYIGNFTQKFLFEMILVANYLEIKRLLKMLCKFVAQGLKNKTPAEICAMYGVHRELTEDEIKRTEEENPWLVTTGAPPRPTATTTSSSS